MADRKKLNDNDRATASGLLLRLCWDAHTGKVNQKQAYDRLESVATTVVRLVEDGVIPAPAWMIAETSKTKPAAKPTRAAVVAVAAKASGPVKKSAVKVPKSGKRT